MQLEKDPRQLSPQQALVQPQSSEIRMALEDTRGDIFLAGIPVNNQEQRIIPYGSWEQWKILDTPMGNEVLHEARLTTTQALVQAGRRTYPNIISTFLGEHIERKMGIEFQAVQKFNDSLYDAVLPEAKRISRIPIYQEDPLLEREPLQQPTAITESFIRTRLEEGFGFSPDRNDARIASLLGNEQLLATSVGLNNKNYFYRFLEQADTGLHYPAAHLFSLQDTRALDILLQKSDEELFRTFMSLAKKELPAETKHYFFKIALSAGGMGVTRLDIQNMNELRTLLIELRARSIDGRNADVQIIAGVPISSPNRDNPTNPENTSYFSPCLTLRIKDAQHFALGQVADQVLKGGTAWVGAYWDRAKEQAMLETVGYEKIQALGSALGKIGYQGYFGTDFIRTDQGAYHMIVDGNARQNGNDSTCLLRKSLSPRMQVESMFLTGMTLPEQVEDAQLYDALQEYLGKFTFDAKTQGGIMLVPNYQPRTMLEEANDRKVNVMYINPKADKERFDEFFTSFI